MVRDARKSALLTMRAPFYRVKKFGAEVCRAGDIAERYTGSLTRIGFESRNSLMKLYY
jgi:hypothetical protein